MHEPPPLVFVDADPSAVQHESDPPIDPTIRLPPVFEEEEEKPPGASAAAPVTRQQWPTPLPAAKPSAPRTLQLPVGTVAPSMTTPNDSAAHDVASDSAPATVARLEQSQRAAVWVIGVGGSAIIILLAVAIGLLVKRNRAEQPAPVEPTPALVEPPPPAEPEPKVVPIPEPNPPELEVVPELVEPKPVDVEPNDPRESSSETEEEPSTEPVPEVEPKPADKPKPKAPQILVIIKVVGSPQKAEVKVGSRNLTKKYNYAVSTYLTPGKHAITWRLPGQEAWHKPGSLVVENIGSKTYEVVLSETKITSTIKGGGSK